MKCLTPLEDSTTALGLTSGALSEWVSEWECVCKDMTFEIHPAVSTPKSTHREGRVSWHDRRAFNNSCESVCDSRSVKLWRRKATEQREWPPCPACCVTKMARGAERSSNMNMFSFVNWQIAISMAYCYLNNQICPFRIILLPLQTWLFRMSVVNEDFTATRCILVCLIYAARISRGRSENSVKEHWIKLSAVP